MMLKLFLPLLFAVNLCYGQKPSLQKDEKGLYIYYEVVEAPSSSRAVLFFRAGLFFMQQKNVSVVSKPAGDSVIRASGKFIVNKTASSLSHPSGEVAFKLTVEVRDNKFRFLLTDFKFKPYKRDRYGNFVPEQVAAIRLEDIKPSQAVEDKDKSLEVVAIQAKALGDKLRKSMLTPAGDENDKKVDTRKW